MLQEQNSLISSVKAAFAASPGPLLRFRGLRKAFGGQMVLDGIDGEIYPGEVVLPAQENDFTRINLTIDSVEYHLSTKGFAKATKTQKRTGRCRKGCFDAGDKGILLLQHRININ